jgi:hypothetical protein
MNSKTNPREGLSAIEQAKCKQQEACRCRGGAAPVSTGTMEAGKKRTIEDGLLLRSKGYFL